MMCISIIKRFCHCWRTPLIRNLLLVVPILFWGLACGSSDPGDDVIARVGPSVLTRSDLNQYLSWSGMSQDKASEFVDRWVNRELLYLEALNQGFSKTDELKWELEVVEKESLVQRLLERTFAQKIRVPQEEIEAYYEKNKHLFRIEEDEVRAYHILTDTREEANQAHQELQAGKTFEEVAQAYSRDMFKPRGGDMGYIRRSDVEREVARQLFLLSNGGVSRVFHTNHGYHIVKAGKKRLKDSVMDLEDAQPEIVQRLRAGKEQAAYFDLIYQLQNSTEVFVAVPKPQQSMSNE